MAFSLFRGIAGILSGIWHFLFNAFTHYDTIVEDVQGIHSSVLTIRANVQSEVEKVKNFTIDPKWKTRVINVPIAVDQIKETYTKVFGDLLELVKEIESPIHDFVLIFKTEQIEQGDPQQAVSALSKAEVKLGHIVTLLTQVNHALKNVVAIVDRFRILRENLEGLDALFLQQGNLRRSVSEKSRIRIGFLHSDS